MPAALPNLLDVQPYTPARAHTQEIQDLGLQVTCLTPGNVILTTLPDELSCHRVVDIGYHGVLKEGEPFDTALKFHDKDCLTILDVVRLRLSTCKFAFLPGSHTAELTQGSIPDEALHIAAAMQHSGFRSVIGSMWETVDGDGQTLAKDVYLSMFSGDDRKVPYYERSAGALRDAVQKMREREVSLVQWVNFVHFGV
jgi:CHAT domain-containing protein